MFPMPGPGRERGGCVTRVSSVRRRFESPGTEAHDTGQSECGDCAADRKEVAQYLSH